MASFNKVVIIGNLTRDPELRYTPQGTAVCNLGLAINTGYKDKKETCFINAVAWQKTAENCSQYLAKGRPVLVEGRLQSRNWEDQQGNKRSVIEIVAENVQFLGGKEEAQQSTPQQSAIEDGFMGNAQASSFEAEEEIVIPGEESMF
jgi:single-strand DNA-binding protein